MTIILEALFNSASTFKASAPQLTEADDSGSLAYLKQLKLYIRELVLNSLPAHWAEWIVKKWDKKIVLTENFDTRYYLWDRNCVSTLILE